MMRENFLSRLDWQLARWVPDQEREDILRWYQEYFDDAGPENEQAVLQELGSPEDLARELAIQRGYLKQESTGLKKWQIIAGAALVVLLSIPVGLLFHQTSAGADRVDVPVEVESVSVAEVEELDSGSDIYLSLPFGNVTVQTGDTMDIHAECQGQDIPLDGGVSYGDLDIYGYQDYYGSDPNDFPDTVQVLVQIPYDTEPNSVSIKVEKGSVTCRYISAQDFYVYVTEGSIYTQYCDAASDFSLYTDHGDILQEGYAQKSSYLSADHGDITVLYYDVTQEDIV